METIKQSIAELFSEPFIKDPDTASTVYGCLIVLAISWILIWWEMANAKGDDDGV